MRLTAQQFLILTLQANKISFSQFCSLVMPETDFMAAYSTASQANGFDVDVATKLAELFDGPAGKKEFWQRSHAVIKSIKHIPTLNAQKLPQGVWLPDNQQDNLKNPKTLQEAIEKLLTEPVASTPLLAAEPAPTPPNYCAPQALAWDTPVKDPNVKICTPAAYAWRIRNPNINGQLKS